MYLNIPLAIKLCKPTFTEIHALASRLGLSWIDVSLALDHLIAEGKVGVDLSARHFHVIEQPDFD